MPKYVLDYGPAVSGTPEITIFRDIATGESYIDNAPTLDTLVSGWTQFTWTSGVTVHFRAEINNSIWITGNLRNASALPVGDGSVRVDHDYGGVDNLRVRSLDTGLPLDGATLSFLLTEDYSAGRTNAELYSKAWVYSDNSGRFANPVYIDPADYTILVTKPGANSSTMTVTVT